MIVCEIRYGENRTIYTLGTSRNICHQYLHKVFPYKWYRNKSFENLMRQIPINFVLSQKYCSYYFCAMSNQIHVYDAIKKMDELTKKSEPFSFAFYKYNKDKNTGGDLVSISKAILRKKPSDDKIKNSSYKLFFMDLDSNEPLNCWQVLIKRFNNMECIL